ncbi:uncharacterized protein BP5553_05245 [Venustampulla echinocandica]|uniref:Uncharacterized protein n=1 Tax=Venustampulla echinocandica TaxID=2656787 RepID=A0A370TQM1_9HELO|nr:uncharacterized protein BP5553_05245 [Venustampulla echinocandica]RDL37812.1 hypothetical protein BP5553_05245 [Venustampulla echinocandica]
MADQQQLTAPAPLPFHTLTAPNSSPDYVALEKSGPPFKPAVVRAPEPYAPEACRFINICHQMEYYMYSPEELRWNFISGLTMEVSKGMVKAIEEPYDPEKQKGLQVAEQVEMLERRLKIEFITQLEKAKRLVIPELAFIEKVAAEHPDMTVGDLWKQIQEKRKAGLLEG